jgi:hypothetical protein
VSNSVRIVLAYFLRNPAAADSLEGIARWRVHQEIVPALVGQVSQALAWLVEERLLLREDRMGGPPTFRLDPARARDARQLLLNMERD